MTAWIAQNKHDRTWLMTFESRPTMDDLIRAGKGCEMGERRDWDIYGYHVCATKAGRDQRKRSRQGMY